jgi:uncharacterized protein (DUF1778 family)
MDATPHNTRLDVRLAANHKDLIEQAASLLGQSVSAFTVSTLVREAGQVVESLAALQLGNRDRDAFLAAMNAPPRPSVRLRRAAKQHALHVRKAAR